MSNLSNSGSMNFIHSSLEILPLLSVSNREQELLRRLGCGGELLFSLSFFSLRRWSHYAC